MNEEILPGPRTPLVRGSVLAAVLRLSVPTMLANVLQSGFVLVDLWFVGRLGTEALAAVGVAGVVMSVVFPFVIGLTVGSNALISRAQGEGDRAALDRAIFTVLVMCALVTVVLTAAGVSLAGPVIDLFGVEPRVHDYALGYIRILFGGSAFMVSLFIVNAILRALGDAVTPFVVLGVSTLVNLGLDPLLIFGAGPLPGLEVNGAAAASVTARAVGLIVASSVLARRHLPRPLLSTRHLSSRVLVKILSIGMPSSVSLMVRHLSGLIVTAIVVQFGTEAVAAYSVCQRVMFLVLMPGFGFAIASAVLVGQNLGAGQPRRAETSSWAAVGCYAVLVVLAAAVLFAVPRPIVALFDDTARVVGIGGEYFRVVAPALLTLPFGLVLSRAMSGAGYTVGPMVVSVAVLMGIRLPLAWGLSRIWAMDGIYWAVAVPVVLEGILVLALFLRGSWKHKQVS